MSAKSWIPNNNRIIAIKESPFSWKERDLLTAAEKYMQGGIDCPITIIAAACFPKIETIVLDKIIQIEQYSLAAFHLLMIQKDKVERQSDTLQFQAARIYEQEAQRILGSVFSLDDSFWKTFYTRQEMIGTRPLVVLDALHFLTKCQEKITHQLLVQGFKAILTGFYANSIIKKENFNTAKRLLVDLALPQLTEWLHQQTS